VKTHTNYRKVVFAMLTRFSEKENKNIFSEFGKTAFFDCLCIERKNMVVTFLGKGVTK